MKKISTILLLFLFCVSYQVKALDMTISTSPSSGLPSIKSSSISGIEKVTLQEEFSLTFNINISGLFKDMPDTFGIAMVGFELIIDDSVFTVEGVSVNDWLTDVERQEDGSYSIESTVKEGNSSNKCVDGLLYCSNYSINIRFKVKDTDKTSSTIEMRNIAVGLLNVDYAEGLSDDMVILQDPSNQNKTITIQKSIETKPQDPPKDPPQVNTPTKSTNNYLKSLQIDNHNIKFLKTKNEYNISIDKEENQLVIHAEVDNAAASYQIIGADDLAGNDYKVQIVVTSESGEKNTYLLNVNIREESGTIYEKPKEEKKPFQFVWKKLYTWIGIGLLVFVIVIVAIVKVRDKKIDRGLDDL